MNIKTLQSILAIGENVAVEFKRCGNGIESDTYETVCSFLNRFGGDIFMGVLDNGTILGISENAAQDMVRNFIKVVSNPALFSPTVYLVPEIIHYDENRTILHVHIPPSAEVHSYKKVIYDRVDDADVKVTATGAIAQMYIRKQNIYTEKTIYPYAKLEDLRLDLLPKIRQMAINHAGGAHPWAEMDDAQLLRSAGLYGKSIATGEEGYNLAAIMLLGKDEVILDVAPAYVTDALVRKVNVDRYDDREIIKTNLIESYEQLFAFGKKNLPDKFFLEDSVNKSLRNTIVREMIGNTLIHREYSSSYTAKFVIEQDRMYVENANRAASGGVITVDNLEPNPKNPIIASFFRNIGYADQLGSGVRNLFKYSKYYSGQEPQFCEGDVFRIIVPLDESFSYDSEIGAAVGEDNVIDRVPINTEGVPTNADKMPISTEGVPTNADKMPINTGGVPTNADETQYENMTPQQNRIYQYARQNGSITSRQAEELLAVKQRRARDLLSEMVAQGILEKQGHYRSTVYVCADK
jgi:ATP-dependent DNA helicase RecG